MPTFEREIFISFKYLMSQAYFRRIHDKFNTGLKPFDFELFYEGFFFGIEAKHQKNRLDLSRIHPHQKEAMEKILRNGGLSYFIIRIENPKMTRGKFRAFVIHYSTFIKMMLEIDKKSCNAKDLEFYAEYEAERLTLDKKKGYYGWSFNIFFERVVRKGANLRLRNGEEEMEEESFLVEGEELEEEWDPL